MKIVKEFIKKYWKKILLALVLFVLTFGFSVLYKLYKNKES